MEPVTIGENVRRGECSNRNKTSCPKGHPYTDDNLYTVPSSGGRACRTCSAEWHAEYMKKEENRERANELIRRRYSENKEFRDIENKKRRERHAATREAHNKRQRERYAAMRGEKFVKSHSKYFESSPEEKRKMLH